jgi:hypothetical protein
VLNDLISRFSRRFGRLLTASVIDRLSLAPLHTPEFDNAQLCPPDQLNAYGFSPIYRKFSLAAMISGVCLSPDDCRRTLRRRAGAGRPHRCRGARGVVRVAASRSQHRDVAGGSARLWSHQCSILALASSGPSASSVVRRARSRSLTIPRHPTTQHRRAPGRPEAGRKHAAPEREREVGEELSRTDRAQARRVRRALSPTPNRASGRALHPRRRRAAPTPATPDTRPGKTGRSIEPHPTRYGTEPEESTRGPAGPSRAAPRAKPSRHGRPRGTCDPPRVCTDPGCRWGFYGRGRRRQSASVEPPARNHPRT